MLKVMTDGRSRVGTPGLLEKQNKLTLFADSAGVKEAFN